jgi:UDP-glucuronate 4-epimerase
MLPMQPGDVPRTYASPDLLRALTAFKPEVRLQEGVRHFVDWYQAQY